MTYADDATKSWEKAIPKVNGDGNVTEWFLYYNYTLGDYSRTFENKLMVEEPSKAPSAYTKAELLTMMDESRMDVRFNKRYAVDLRPSPVITFDETFDVNTLGD
jgi:hypothetical protein|tara:strand:+ start:1429 stop:1740 length:312 start_codon:yes stop_codon:yes gene_type:complete